jgi:hypothetical protein
VVVQFSQPIDPASVSASTFSVTAGSNVAGTRPLSASPLGPNSFRPGSRRERASGVQLGITQQNE